MILKENYTADMHGRGFAAMWHNVKKPLQLVSIRDIGIVAAKAITEPENPDFHNKALSLAGDALTQDDACKVYQKVFGTRMPMIFPFVGDIVKWKIPEVRIMFQWFSDVGFGASIDECRKINPAILDFEHWLKEESPFRKQ